MKVFKKGDIVVYIGYNSLNQFLGRPGEIEFTVEEVWNDTIKISKKGTTNQIWIKSSFFKPILNSAASFDEGDKLVYCGGITDIVYQYYLGNPGEVKFTFKKYHNNGFLLARDSKEVNELNDSIRTLAGPTGIQGIGATGQTDFERIEWFELFYLDFFKLASSATGPTCALGATGATEDIFMNLLPFFMELTQFKVTSSYIHQWPSYNKATVFEAETEDYIVDIAFDKNMDTISMCVWDNKRNRIYNWINDKFRQDVMIDYEKFQQHDGEYQEINIEVLSDFQEKAQAIVEGREYDDRVVIELEFDKETKLKLFELAHEQDVTLNKFIEKLILEKSKEVLNG